MRQSSERFEQYRLSGNFGGPIGSAGGTFRIPVRGSILQILSTFGGAWDHVSVSHASRIPTWLEMCDVKDFFFYPDEVVMQLHPAAEKYVNNHPRCLHLWRPQTAAEIQRAMAHYSAIGQPWVGDDASPGIIPTPPTWMVGLKEIGVLP